MASAKRQGITRRSVLTSAVATGAVVAGGWWATRRYSSKSPTLPGLIPGEPLALTPDGKLLDTSYSDPFAGGEYLGYLPFLQENEIAAVKPGQRFGKGHNGRRVIDTSSLLTPEGRKTPNDRFYIRTEYPDLLQAPPEWKIKIHGEVKKSKEVPLAELLPVVEQKDPVLVECSGNARDLGFGLLSVATWAGVPINEIIKRAEPNSKAKAILFNGFDADSNLPDEPPYQTNSWPTCSWIFTFDQLLEGGAFLATELNGAPLPKEQGAPVRLIVPGWYGCTEAKWVNEIKFLDNEQPATLQMREFASRTFQRLHVDDSGARQMGAVGPDLARDYRPATIDQVALPVRVEAWRLDGKLAYRVIGITWGGPKRTDKLLIRFVHGNAPKYGPVQFCQTTTSSPAYGIWCHRWQPQRRGAHWIEMRLGDPKIRARKMSVSSQIAREKYVTYHARLVQIPEI
jgi:DMSO/TMAO reductase YedYZ molybdopterin-dependent catalytic subunit